MSELTPAIARTLLADATPGEWKAASHQVSMRGVATAIETSDVRIMSHDPFVRLADAQIMAAAPGLARAYLAAVERAEAAERERDALRAKVARYADAHAARVAHSAREPHDEDWYAERDEPPSLRIVRGGRR